MQRLTGSITCLRREDAVRDWRPIDTAPFGEDLQLGVIDGGEVHALVFPCRRGASGWSHGLTHKPISVRPSHWRPWTEASVIPPDPE
jgi:hypothetical protein